MAELTTEEARELIQTLGELVQMANRALPARRSRLAERLEAHLGAETLAQPATSLRLSATDHVNVQLALDALAAEAASFEILGLSPDIGQHHGVSIAMLAGQPYGLDSGAAHYVSLPTDVDETLDCLRSGLILATWDGVPVAVLIYMHERGPVGELVVEALAPSRDAAVAVLDRLQVLMDEHNVYRGKTIAFSFGRHGGFGLDFVRVPAVQRDEVILPPGSLDAIEHHAIEIGERADELRDLGQHVKRGLLLYGPPGTGKTHTLSYLLGAAPGRTTVILSGPAVQAVGQAGTIARDLAPATIVIEDVDLIAEERGMPGMGTNPLLFQLLNEMDGLGDDADVLFILTTNRIEALEHALTARPGRIDQAIEIGLPDATARRRLLDLYAGSAPDEVVARLDGVTASFIKELARRAALGRLREGRAQQDLDAALTEMLEQSAPVLLRSLTGTATDQGPHTH